MSITLERACEVKKCSVSLSASQVFLGDHAFGCMRGRLLVGLVASTCGGFRERLQVEVRADFERLILSGSRVLEFLASQGVAALGNLVL